MARFATLHWLTEIAFVHRSNAFWAFHSLALWTLAFGYDLELVYPAQGRGEIWQ